jgi:signal transduction histidine kinase/CheY-like chemotaxis protein/integral membrane sensor domain MASE1
MSLPATTSTRAHRKAWRWATQEAVRVAAFGLLYYVLAAFSAGLPVQTRLPLFIYPATGLALGVLLVTPKRRWLSRLAAVFVANLLLGLELGVPYDRTLSACAIATAMPLVVALLMRRFAGPRVRIESTAGVGRFLFVIFPAMALLSIPDTMFSLVRYEAPVYEQWLVGFVSGTMGMLVVAPLVLAWTRRGTRSAWLTIRARAPELVLMYAGLLVTTNIVFGTGTNSPGYIPGLGYLCAPFFVWSALRFGLRASTISLAIFSLFCYWHTSYGSGPFILENSADWRSMLHLQGYLMVIVVTTLLASALVVERRQAALASEAWQRRYEAVIRASGNLVYDLDPGTGRLRWVGDTSAVLGLRSRQLGNISDWAERVHPDDRTQLSGLRQLLSTGVLPHVSVEYRIRRDDGNYITVGVNGYSIEDPAPEPGRTGRHVIGFVKDVSDKAQAEAERERLEAQLKQAEKLEAIGRLAGGIAHDFNNILGAILGYGELAQRKNKDQDVSRYLDTMTGAGNRAKALVTQILSFSRPESLGRSAVAVAAIAGEVCELVRGSMPPGLALDFEADVEDAWVMGDPTRLYQLLMNLCTNAMQAMPGGGLLGVRITSENVAHNDGLPRGEYVRIEVSDTGHGIPAELRERIFEPFFTTKPTGEGTGLGLALVHAIAKEHQGSITFTSEIGKGTTFVVLLPMMRDPAVAEGGIEALPRGRGEAVLCVEDERDVLGALEEMVAVLGYEPVGFQDPRAALDQLRASPSRFAVVISDEVMPGLSGTQLAVEAHQLRPSLPVIIASGYGGVGFETRLAAAGVGKVLRKPYQLRSLAEALATALRRP